MIQVNAQSHSVSKFNVLAQPTQPMIIADATLARLAGLSNNKQWILFTADCPRPDYDQFVSCNISCTKIIQMKPSQTQSEFEIVVKAIKSGNASAVVASNNIALVEQSLLQKLAQEHLCEVFFVEGKVSQFH